MPANIDFSTVNVDNISDDQLSQLLQKAQQNGLTVDDVVQQAQAKGMPPDQVAKLRDRLNQLSAGTSSGKLKSTTTNQNSDYGRKYNYKPLSVQDSLSAIEEEKEKAFRKRIYGASLFSNANLTFEPNLNIPTPGNYVIGPGDQLVLNVFGYSEKTDHLVVTPEGYVNIENVGPVQVNGLTIDEAKVKISRKLQAIYSGVASGNTQVQLSLGEIRSIRVMVIGEIMRPGTYTVPSVTTIANALYVSGGPNTEGSFRDIQLIRAGQVIDTFDLYDFLAHGSLAKNMLLRDQDIVKVNPYQTRVELEGEVKHPAIFEAKPGERLGDIIRYAGGYTDKAFKGFVRSTRVNNREKELSTVPRDAVEGFELKPGDIFYVDSILNKYTNRVSITGAVAHPGAFALKPGMTVKDLIGEADGLTEGAFMNRGLIKRLKSDYSPEMVGFSVGDVLSGATPLPLQREDSVFIYAKSKIHEPYYVIVRGEVNKPDTIPFAEGMHLGDVVLLSGGLKDAASLNQIEIGRRVRSQQYDPRDTSLAIVGRFSIQNDLAESPAAREFAIQPFDQIMVRHAPGYYEQIVVTIEGEVVYPGQYVINARNEKISDLVMKAGGLRPDAFAEGARLMRQAGEGDAAFEKNKLDVFVAANRGDDSLEVRKVRAKMDSTMKLVGIRLDKALQSPDSKYDLLLQKGDVIRVPKKLETVSLFGEVFYPKDVRFDNRLRFKDFISQAGGFTVDALRRGSYVVYPNGEVASTRKVLFFNHYPRIKPGSEIFVPAKKPRKGFEPTVFVGLLTGIVTLTAVLITLLK